MCKKKGQSILEYVIVLTTIIAVIVGVAWGLNQSTDTQGLKRLFGDAATRINTAAGRLGSNFFSAGTGGF